MNNERLFCFNAVSTESSGIGQILRYRLIRQFIDEYWPVYSGFARVRVHDLKHTFGRRLRAAGVSNETRKVLLGHRNGDITSHYSEVELTELLEAVGKVCGKKSGTDYVETKKRLTLSC